MGPVGNLRVLSMFPALMLMITGGIGFALAVSDPDAVTLRWLRLGVGSGSGSGDGSGNGSVRRFRRGLCDGSAMSVVDIPWLGGAVRSNS